MQAIIIDDDKTYCLIIKSAIEKIGEKVGLHIDITIADEIKEILSLNTIYDIYFIDIEMPDMNGLDLVKNLRKKHVDKNFVFISFYEKYMRPAFFVKPTAFVRKEFLSKDLEEALLFIKANREKKRIGVQIKDSKKNLLIYPYRIMYCESVGHYVKIYPSEGVPFLIRNKLSYVQENLSEYDFVRIHSRYLINLNFVKDNLKENIVMLDDRRFPISDTYRPAALNRIMIWFVHKNPSEDELEVESPNQPDALTKKTVAGKKRDDE